jgi:hypothetical protein
MANRTTDHSLAAADLQARALELLSADWPGPVGLLPEARELLTEAITLDRPAGGVSPYRATPHLWGEELPVWLVALEGQGLDRDGRATRPPLICCRFVRDHRAETGDEFDAPAMTAEQAAAAAYLLAEHDEELWADQVIAACVKAVDGWRPPADEVAAARRAAAAREAAIIAEVERRTARGAA